MATKIESKHVEISASQASVYQFLTDFNNYIQLLPKDQISDWTSTENDCSFKVQGMAVIPLIKDRVEESSKIYIVSGEKAPFSFTLEITLNDKGTSTEAFLNFEGEINAFLKMMVVKPLTNLFDYMADRLKKVCEE